MPEAEPLEETLAQPGRGAEQPAEVGQAVAHLLDELHLLIQEVAPGSPEVESARAEPRACGPTGPGAGSSPSSGGFHGVLGFPHAPGTASARPGRGRGHSAAFAFSSELGASGFSSARSRNDVSRPGELLRRVGREAQRQVGVGERQMHVTRRVTAASTGRSNRDESGSSCLVGSKELSSENGVGCSRRARRAEWVIPRL